MNIFLLDTDHVKCAQAHGDIHLNKMIVETAQMLSAAHHIIDGPEAIKGLYKLTHPNHPCTKWVRETPFNYNWAWWHLQALILEYAFRREKAHATEKIWEKLAIAPSNFSAPWEKTPHPLCMPKQFITSNNPVTCYRNYMLHKFAEKPKLAKWTRRQPPEWAQQTKDDSGLPIDILEIVK